MDVAGAALALVELGHEGERLSVVGRDLLGRVAVDDVVVARAHRRVEEEADLVLAVVALALGALDDGAGGIHLVADLAQERLDAVAAEDRVVDVVAVRRRQPV